MKTLITVLLAITFSWLPNGESDLAGYNLHYNDVVVDCGLPDTVDGRVHYSVEGVDGEADYWATAYDKNGNESGPSDVVTHDPAPAEPQDFNSIEVNVTVKINGGKK